MADGDRLYIVRNSSGWGAPAIPNRELIEMARRGAITPASELRDPITNWTGTAWEHPVLRAVFVQNGVAGPEDAAAPAHRAFGRRGAIGAGTAAVVATLGAVGWWWVTARSAARADRPATPVNGAPERAAAPHAKHSAGHGHAAKAH